MIPSVTIIMPSLNVADYIRPCIESVLGQTMEDMEIIVVDAGSEDGTLEIIKEYAQKDSRIKLIESEKRSYGYQLNTGIALAKGEYVGVVETDDIVESDMCEKLYHVAKDTRADYVKGVAEGFFTSLVGDDIRYSMKIFKQEEYDACGGAVEMAPCQTPELTLRDYYVWNGLYRREFIKSVRLNDTEGAAFQDIGFIAQVHLKAEKAIYLDKLIYHYRRNSKNSSCGNKNARAFRYLNQEYAYVNRLLAGKESRWRTSIAIKMVRQIIGRFWSMAYSGEFWKEALPDMLELKKRVEELIQDEVIKGENLTDMEWCQMMCLTGSPKLLYEACEKAVHYKIKAVQVIIDAIGNREAIIFGCGELGRFLHVLLGNRKPGQIAAYCDNRRGQMKESVQGIEVLEPQEAVLKYPEAVYIIANKYHGDEMKRQLCGYGVYEGNILLYTEKKDWVLIEKFL